VVIDLSDVISTDLRSEHWRGLWQSLSLTRGLVPVYPIVSHRLEVEAKVSLYTPSSLNLLRRLFKNKIVTEQSSSKMDNTSSAAVIDSIDVISTDLKSEQYIWIKIIYFIWFKMSINLLIFNSIISSKILNF